MSQQWRKTRSMMSLVTNRYHCLWQHREHATNFVSVVERTLGRCSLPLTEIGGAAPGTDQPSSYNHIVLGVGTMGRSADPSDGFDLNEHLRLSEARLDRGTRRRVLGKDLGKLFIHDLKVSYVRKV